MKLELLKEVRDAPKWRTKVTYIDEDTGEILYLKKEEIERNYIIKKIDKKIKNGKKRKTIEYTKLCKWRGQGELEFKY